MYWFGTKNAALNEAFWLTSRFSSFYRVRKIMEKDALKDPKTSRNAANAKRLLPEVCTGQVHILFYLLYSFGDEWLDPCSLDIGLAFSSSDIFISYLCTD